jgi:hypothetical protein
LYEGRIVGEAAGQIGDAERQRIGLMMTGQYRVTEGCDTVAPAEGVQKE